MQIEERAVGAIVVLSVTGEITLNHLGVVKAKVQSLLDQGRRQLLIDLKNVSIVDSAGLGELVVVSYVTSKNAGGSVKLVNLTDRTKELLRISKLAPLFDTYDSEEAAIASFASASV